VTIFFFERLFYEVAFALFVATVIIFFVSSSFWPILVCFHLILLLLINGYSCGHSVRKTAPGLKGKSGEIKQGVFRKLHSFLALH